MLPDAAGAVSAVAFPADAGAAAAAVVRPLLTMGLVVRGLVLLRDSKKLLLPEPSGVGFGFAFAPTAGFPAVPAAPRDAGDALVVTVSLP